MGWAAILCKPVESKRGAAARNAGLQSAQENVEEISGKDCIQLVYQIMPKTCNLKGKRQSELRVSSIEGPQYRPHIYCDPFHRDSQEGPSKFCKAPIRPTWGLSGNRV